MANKGTERDRLSIDVLPEEHRQIKIYATIHGQTMREYVLESIRERLCQEKENKDLQDLTMHLDQDSALKELWNNKKDAGYDKQNKKRNIRRRKDG